MVFFIAYYSCTPKPMVTFTSCCNFSTDQVKNSYYIGLDGSLRLVLANGMEVSLNTERHLLSGTVNPTVSRRNVTLPIDNGLNLVEWRQRKEQAQGQVAVYGRRLRVKIDLCLTFPLSHKHTHTQISF